MHRNFTLRHPRFAFFGILLCLGLFRPTVSLWADEPADAAASDGTAGENPAADQETAGQSPPLASLIFVDPVSGELTSQPTPEQEAWLREDLLRRGKTLSLPVDLPPVPFPLRDGGEGVFLGDRMISATVILRRADGSWETGCTRPDHPTGPHGEGGESATEGTTVRDDTLEQNPPTPALDPSTPSNPPVM